MRRDNKLLEQRIAAIETIIHGSSGHRSVFC